MGKYFGNIGLFGRVSDVELEEIRMEKQSSTLTHKTIGWKVLFSFNTIVLFLFWLLALTDYSWYHNQVSISYSVLVLCTCVITFVLMKFLGIFQRVLLFIVCLLTFIMTLVSIPLHRYHSDKTPVQVELSPNGTRFVEVYCSFTPAHNTGFDHIEIIVRNKKFPYLQRDLGLYNNYSHRHCVGNMDSLVRWDTNNKIYVVERQAYLSVDNIKWEGVLADPGEINGDN